MREPADRLRALVFCAGLALSGVAVNGPASAQMPFVPPEFYNPVRPAEGQGIRFCIWTETSTAAYDRAVAEEIANALLLVPSFHEITEPLGTLSDEDFWQLVFVVLAESCSAMMSAALVPGTRLEDWLTITQPYLEAPYVLATRDPDIDRLGDLPPRALLGAPLYTSIDLTLLAYLRTQPKEREWRRVFYDLQSDMVAHLLDGVLQAAIVWEPTLVANLAGRPDHGVRIASLQPLPEEYRRLAIVLRADDRALRMSLDEAITTLREQGILDELERRHGLALP